MNCNLREKTLVKQLRPGDVIFDPEGYTCNVEKVNIGDLDIRLLVYYYGYRYRLLIYNSYDKVIKTTIPT